MSRRHWIAANGFEHLAMEGGHRATKAVVRLQQRLDQCEKLSVFHDQVADARFEARAYYCTDLEPERT